MRRDSFIDRHQHHHHHHRQMTSADLFSPFWKRAKRSLYLLPLTSAKMMMATHKRERMNLALNGHSREWSVTVTDYSRE